jgi:hypothetical protein
MIVDYSSVHKNGTKIDIARLKKTTILTHVHYCKSKIILFIVSRTTKLTADIIAK